MLKTIKSILFRRKSLRTSLQSTSIDTLGNNQNDIKMLAVDKDQYLIDFLRNNVAGSFQSYALSLHDEPYKPNRKLLRLVLETVSQAINLSVRENILLFPNEGDIPEDVKLYSDIYPGEHYRFLTALIKVMQPKLVIEIGTYRGISALAMKQFLPKQSKIVTYDVIPWDQISGRALKAEHFDQQLEQRIYDLTINEISEHELRLIELADIIFVDAAKDGEMERKFCSLFERVKFIKPPIIVFDDIKMLKMLEIWRTIRHPKLDITSFGHWSGTGIVDWGGAIEE
jgi:hypothetical protein